MPDSILTEHPDGLSPVPGLPSAGPGWPSNTPGLPGSTGQAPGLPQTPMDISLETSEALVPGRNFGGRVDDNGFGWAVGANEFAPAGYRPNESRSTQIGKYGGAPLYAATQGMPWGAIASRIQASTNKKNEARKALQQFDPMAGVEDVNAPEYRDSFRRGVMSDLFGVINDAKANWGEEEGLRRLQTPGTPEYMALRERGSDWTTVSRLMNQSTKEAAAVLKGMEDGSIDNDEELKQRAQDVLYRTGEYAGQQDPKKLAQSMERLQGTIGFYNLMKQDGISQLLKNGGTTEDLAEAVRSGNLTHRGFATWLNTKKVDRSSLVDSLTDYYSQRYPKVPKEDIRKRINDMAPASLEQTVSSKAIPRAKGFAGSGKSKAQEDAKYATDATTAPSSIGVDTEVYRPTISLFAGPENNMGTAKPITLYDGSKQYFAHPERVINVDGKLYVVGKETGMSRTRAIKKGEAMGLDVDNMNRLRGAQTEEEVQNLVTEFELLEEIAVPYDGQNASRINQMFGLDYKNVQDALVVPGQLREGASPARKSAGSISASSIRNSIANDPAFAGENYDRLVAWYKEQGYDITED